MPIEASKVERLYQCENDGCMYLAGPRDRDNEQIFIRESDYLAMVAERDGLLSALEAAELAEATLIQWAAFWDEAPTEVLDALEGAQTKRNAAMPPAQQREVTK